MKKLSQTLWSVWSWFVFGTCIVLWLPMMAVVWVVTAPFDPPRYWTGLLFRKLTVVHEKLNPLWTCEVGGTVLQTERIYIDRGQVRRLDLSTCIRRAR